ncbi:GntR family transcriptional regulator [Acuticoccus mangrovi]|uniref:GntR family transcriptional regulator n=1 Tax=Acuticoccus mangrovi TaxID=2796142 RepID=A0A934MLE4_9HYPH|nr:GntR family transcriptional regulator [Acuticoccus mangrovi]MBJ3776294.1 GntR family transcriptional regulator [Acuticoccus mangrovi]
MVLDDGADRSGMGRGMVSGAGSSAAARLYDDVRRRIISMEIAPDSILSRAELAREYGVSLTPVREAIQHLERDGLVVTFPQSRTVVTRIDASAMFEAHFLRVSVETEVVRKLAAGRHDDAWRQAGALIRMQESLVGDIDQIGMFYSLDDTFHRLLFTEIGHLGIYGLLSGLSGHLARARRLDVPRTEKMQAVVDEHRAVLDALLVNDPEGAAEAMRGHLSGTIRRIQALRAAHPNAFIAA